MFDCRPNEDRDKVRNVIKGTPLERKIALGSYKKLCNQVKNQNQIRYKQSEWIKDNAIFVV